MIKLINWLKSSKRYLHIICGAFIGIGADSFYCAIYSGIAVASALEYKDKAWGGSLDWIDFALTIIGAILGYLIILLL